jgi:hypothetical protein
MLGGFFRIEKNEGLDREIDAVLDEMQRKGVLSEDYPELLSHLERLQKIKETERLDPVSRDTLALIAGNLMGVLLIIAYEQKHVITSKGFNQIIRPRSIS